MDTKKSVVVSLCCNDPDTGNFEGQVTAIHIGEIELEGADYEGDEIKGAPMRYADNRTAVEICGKEFPITDYRYGYGNWCWDGVEMGAETAIELLNWLRINPVWKFGCEAAPTPIFDLWGTDKPFSVEHIPLLIDEETDDDFYHFMR